MTTKPPAPHLRDFLTDPQGRLSHTRLWSNVGSLAATIVFIRMGWTGTLTAEIFAFYLAGVCGHAALSKYLTLKHGGQAFPEVPGA